MGTWNLDWKNIKGNNMNEKTLEQVERETSDRKYTKGDCYALCEFLECLCRDCGYVIADVADALGYEPNRMTELLQRLDCDINNVICDEQDERDYTEQMADIMQIVHISGHND